MHIYDNRQMSAGSVKSDLWDEWYRGDKMWTLVLILPEIGAFVTYEGESYVIGATTTYQEESGKPDKPDITTKCRIHRIDEEGNDLPIEAIWVNADELTLI